MPRPIKRMSKAKGLPPGTLVHIGEEKTEKVKITVIDYDQSAIEEKEVKTVEECFPYKDKSTITWINVDGIHQTDIIQKIGDNYGLHPLVLEDIVNTGQRPKMEDCGDYIFIVLKMLYLNNRGDLIVAEQVSLILGKNYVISFQEREGDVFSPIRDRLKNAKGRIRQMGADYLAYALIDAIVDGYFVVLEKTGERIEFVEDKLITNPRPKILQLIHNVKSDMIFLRRSVWPLREVIGGMQRSESALIQNTTEAYLRDVYDHTIQVVDSIESYREMASGLLDIYLSSISNRMNEVMKVLTIIATIFIPLTFIAGIYGMNFKYMPELGWPWGYPLVLGVMILIGLVMIAYFKRKKWI
ncbi:magnesium transporter [candidate division WOR-1 bacterium DG_54_3]|uniref:Magnesium transport protein CorA n=1 Tax=candidate division WOR-1 bacterium DG_54_3 TaxID=1703775 RepID=A0A0S7Y4G5_UNCSA|nr:MAG: magnesium transporter [candidate division WOR-1 bacterium DG_54_3]